ncbi:MAG TPA: DUF1521 domain-containing protein [Ideonella sp.]|nr:DUF1521 domain-containing protein [Ideonella sp.]
MTYFPTSTTSTAPSCPPGSSVDPANPSNASTTMQGGQAVFENDSYRITMGDNNTVHIKNKETGETYEAWGDPHMKIDGQHAFDFWGTTTFKLEDGTKVTIETTPWAQDPSMTLSSRVTITNGDYGVQISGIDTNQTGDLKIHQAEGWGKTLDWAVNDGNRLSENAHGSGFVARDHNGSVRPVDQQYINQTDLLKGGGADRPQGGAADRLQAQFKDAFRLLGGLVSISFAGLFLGALAGRQQGGSQGNEGGGRTEPFPRPADGHGRGHGGQREPAPQTAAAASHALLDTLRFHLTLARAVG